MSFKRVFQTKVRLWASCISLGVCLALIVNGGCGDETIVNKNQEGMVLTGAVNGISDCLSSSESLSGADTSASLSCVEWSYDGAGTINFVHSNAGFNCCADSIEITVSVDDLVITIEEVEHAEMPCRCLCLYELEFEINGVVPGNYTIRIIEPYLPEAGDPVDFQIDLNDSTSGVHCVPRSTYPWSANI